MSVVFFVNINDTNCITFIMSIVACFGNGIRSLNMIFAESTPTRLIVNPFVMILVAIRLIIAPSGYEMALDDYYMYIVRFSFILFVFHD